MKKTILLTALLTLFGLGATSCTQSEPESAKERVEEGYEDTKDALKEGTEEMSDEIDDATDY